MSAIERIGYQLTRSGCRFIVHGIRECHMVGGIYLIWEIPIEGVLGRLPGIQEVKANYKTQNVLLKLDPQKLTVQAIKEKLQELGYTTAK